MKLGLVTYNLARDWDLSTLIDHCQKLRLAAVELRTTHAHGVEPSLSAKQREEVKKRFADSGIVLWGLGTTCEFHHDDLDVVEKNIETAKEFLQLAHDVGAKGIKVRPNHLPKKADEREKDRTLERIGRAVRKVGRAAASLNQEVWMEMHGSGTAHPPCMRRIMDVADLPNVGVAWNSNLRFDLKNGSVKPYFELMRDKILSVHINELINGYPYEELFTLLNASGYDRYTLIEAQPLQEGNAADAERFLRYYIKLWDALSQSG
jgi:sugar phosphate isomerase/epimerase